MDSPPWDKGEIVASEKIPVKSPKNLLLVLSPRNQYSTPMNNTSDQRGVRFLIADDDPTCQRIAEMVLQAHGLVVTASDGAEALRRLEQSFQLQQPFAAALIDIFMPGLDGIETIRRIRALEADRAQTGDVTTPMRIIVSSVSNSRRMVEQHVGDLIDARLTKPLDRNELLDQLRAWQVIPPASGGPEEAPTETFRRRPT